MNSAVKQRANHQLDNVLLFFNSQCPSAGATKAFLQKPDTNIDQLARMYNFLALRAYNTELRAFEQMPFNPSRPLDPELFGCGYAKVMLVAAINTVVSHADDKLGFTIMDILSPTSGRTVRAMAVLIDVIQANDRCAPIVSGMLNDFEKARFERQHMRESVNKMKTDLNELVMKKQEEKNRARELRAEYATIQNELQGAAEESSKLKSSAESKEQKCNRDKEALESLNHELVLLKRENDNLERDIIANPEMLKSEVERIRGVRGQIGEEINNLTTNLEDIKQRKKQLTGVVSGKIELLTEELKHVTEQKEQLEEKNREVDEQRQGLMAIRRRIEDDLERNIEQLQSLLHTRQQSQAKNIDTYEQTVAALNERKSKHLQDLADLEAKQNENVVMADEIERECEHIKRDIEALKAEKKPMERDIEEQRQLIWEAIGRLTDNCRIYTEHLDAELHLNATTFDITLDRSRIPDV